MHTIATHTAVYPRTCLGCQKYERDVMLSFLQPDGGFTEVFLTTRQASDLVNQIYRVLVRNGDAAQAAVPQEGRRN